MRPENQVPTKIEFLLLRLGILVPILYYGIQLLSAPTFPGYSFISNVASDLGSDKARNATIFNVGIYGVGTIAILASYGFFRAFIRRGTNLVLASLTSIAIAIIGFQSLWAGYYPLPDPRHGGHPALLIAMLALPYFMAAVMWKQIDSRWLKGFYIASMLVIVIMAPIMSGIAGVDTVALQGLLQRLLTLGIFPTIGVSAYVLAQQWKS